jgi:hypothetical protein
LDEEEVAKNGYTKDLLKKLLDKGLIIDTLDILKNKKILNILSGKMKAKSADYRNKYSESLIANWRITSDLYQDGKGEIFQYIFDKLVYAY